MNNKNPIKIMTNKHIARSLALSGLLLAITGCNNSLVNNKPPQALDNKILSTQTDKVSVPKNDSKYIAADDSASTPEGINAVVNANNQFAVSMYQQLNKQPEQKDKNVIFSPYSLSTAMAMLYAAADGETKQQIQKTFHYPALNVLNPNSAALHKQFNKPNPDYKLATVNDLWMQQGLTPNKAYIDTVQRYYGGNVTNLDFESSPEPSRQTINKTIAAHTHQLIPELLAKDSITTDTATVLTNAAYFKGDWSQPFSVRGDKQPFYNLDSSTTAVTMMYQLSYFDYTEDNLVQVVALPYKGNDLSMIVILPKSKDKSAIDAIVNTLTTAQIRQWTDKLESKKVNVKLPKFKLEESYRMREPLTKMGMPIAFSDRADFKLFNKNLPLTVDTIIHKAVIDVDEKGTVAAAGTGTIVISPVSASYNAELEANHPFIFMIKDNKTDAILFLGQVNKP